MITLTQDQTELVGKLRAAMSSGHKHNVLQAATGSGKTIMSSFMVQAAISKGKKVWFTVPRKELLRQTALTFKGFGVPHSYIAAGQQYNPYQKAQICSIGTLMGRLDNVKAPDLAFIDEAHYGGDGLERIIFWLKKQGAWTVLLSATPWKLSGQGLGRYATNMICGPPIRWLIDNKRLSDYRLFAPSKPDLSGIKTTAGDYAKGQLAERMEQDRVLIGNAVTHYKDHALGKLNVAYCVSRKHSELVAESFRNQGIAAVHIDGETPDEMRRKIIRGFAKREITVLTNCDLLTFGFDLSSQVGFDVTVESMSDLRPTKSLALQMQKWGRVLRKKDFPAMIFDHAGNVLNKDGTPNHGLPCEERHWTLEDREKKERSEKTSFPVRQCPSCFFCHSPAPACPSCGEVYVIKHRQIDEVDGELSEISIADRRAAAEKKNRDKFYQLVGVAKKRGYANPEIWAKNCMMVEGKHGIS